MDRLGEYSSEFKGKTCEQVFDGIALWLKNEGAEIKESTRPSMITAIHGSRKTNVWERNARKVLKFRIFTVGESTQVKVETFVGSVLYKNTVPMVAKRIYINYGLLLEEIWASVNGGSSTPTSEIEKTSTREQELLAMKTLTGIQEQVTGKAMMIKGAIILAIVFSILVLVVLAFGPFTGLMRTAVSAGAFAFGMSGGLLLIYGAIKFYTSRN